MRRGSVVDAQYGFMGELSTDVEQVSDVDQVCLISIRTTVAKPSSQTRRPNNQVCTWFVFRVFDSSSPPFISLR